MARTRKDNPSTKDSYSRFSDAEIRDRYQELNYDVDTSLTFQVV